MGAITAFKGDVAALQQQVKADLENVRAALVRCALADKFSPTITPGDWDAWQSLKERAEAFIAEDPSFLSSGSQYDRGEAIQKELAAWHGKADALGCSAGPAPIAPAGGFGDFNLASMFSGMSSTALLFILALLLFRSK